eukprot:366465-Chlamydomonas_euryale.AAC.19
MQLLVSQAATVGDVMSTAEMITCSPNDTIDHGTAGPPADSKISRVGAEGRKVWGLRILQAGTCP